jgi:tetratricopeptide (TPR) repeat protein
MLRELNGVEQWIPRALGLPLCQRDVDGGAIGSGWLMPKGKSNSVFVSYRREVGGILAMALFQQLTERQVDAFYDIESIRAGQFNTIILNQIAARPYFVLVLTPGTLERCREEGDWLHREMQHAVSTSRIVIPVYTPNFDFNDFDRFVPGDLGRVLRGFNGLELPQRWFKYAVQQLVEEFLLPVALPSAVTPSAHQPTVQRMRQQALAAPPVTEIQLSAEEYFERAYNRADEDPGAAIADYDQVIRLNPQRASAFNNRGFARQVMGDLDAAIADYDQAIRLNPQYALAFYNRGNAHREKGDLGAAIADYDQAIRLNHEDADAFLNRGIARQGKGDLDAAIADYDQAIRLDPQHALAFYNRGLAHRKKGDLDAAIADYDQAIRLNPEHADAFNNRGFARQTKGDLDAAIADYDQAMRLNPQHALAFYNRARARQAKGDLRGAIADAERGHLLAPTNDDFLALLGRLKG